MDERISNNGSLGELPDEVQRWTAKRRAALVLAILRDETSVWETARWHDLTVAEVEESKDRYLLAAENALRLRPKEEEALKDEQIEKLERKVGQLVIDLVILKEASMVRPFHGETSDEHETCYLQHPSGGCV